VSFGNMKALRFVFMIYCHLDIRNAILHVVYERILVPANECAPQNSKLFQARTKEYASYLSYVGISERAY
jgi:hypothetical protein